MIFITGTVSCEAWAIKGLLVWFCFGLFSMVLERGREILSGLLLCSQEQPCSSLSCAQTHDPKVQVSAPGVKTAVGVDGGAWSGDFSLCLYCE